jgi:serine protease Do
MERALDVHKNPPAPRPRAGLPVRAEDFAGAQRHRGCIHCHDIIEFRRADRKAAGTWDRDDVWVYPLPENVGVTLDVDVGNKVKAVRPGSPADRVGLKAGDVVKSLNGQPVASFADATFALHKAPARGSVGVTWVSGGRERSGSLEVADGWRKTDLTWRPSMLDIIPSLPFLGDDLSAMEKKRLGLPEARAVFRQGDPVHSSLAAAGIGKGDVVIGFDGAAVDGAKADLLGSARRNYLVGDRVTVNLIRGGQRVDVVLVLK